MTMAPVEAALSALARRRGVFHSEADFQHALAWQLQLDHPAARVRLETRPLPGKALALDLLFEQDGLKTAVELKYLVRSLVIEVAGERFELRAQSAHDVRRYDVVKDICRLEAVVAAGAADDGVLVALSNDPAYWSPGRAGTIDAAFRVHEGARLSGTVGWAPHAGAGTMAKRTEPLTLVGSYELRWQDFSDCGQPAGRFRALVVPVTPSLAAPRHPPTGDTAPGETLERVRDRPAPSVSASPLRTCREEILDAFATLERRHGRDTFSPAELVAEVLARGSTHPESTIRTHVVSAMCVNAPPNHAVRYPDLERVGRGRYRRARG